MNYDRLLQLGGIDREVPPIPGYITKEQLQGEIDGINVLIPEEASDENQLADKAYVNNKVSTDSATFRGTYNLVSDLSLTTSTTREQVATALGTAIPTADNNDFCYVEVPTDDARPTEIAHTDRYKFNGTAWVFEYQLNSITAVQWDAINSGINATLVGKLNSLSVTSCRPFKEGWPTNTTLAAFCAAVVADTDAVVGQVYLGQLGCSGLPDGMANGEAEVKVTQGLSGKLLVITMTSTNLSPFHWEQSYYNNTLYGWKSWTTKEDFNTESAFQKNLAAIMSLAANPNAGVTTKTTDPEWKLVYTDNDDRILLGKRQDNT